MKITYPNLDSARRPVLHDALMLVLLPPKERLSALANKVEEDFDKECSPASSTATNSEYDPEKSLKPILFSESLKAIMKGKKLNEARALLTLIFCIVLFNACRTVSISMRLSLFGIKHFKSKNNQSAEVN